MVDFSEDYRSGNYKERRINYTDPIISPRTRVTPEDNEVFKLQFQKCLLEQVLEDTKNKGS